MQGANSEKIRQGPGWNQQGVPSQPFFWARLGGKNSTTYDLLKFCKKVLDILTDWEHYDPTLGRGIPLVGPLSTTARDPFRAVGEQAFSCRNLGRELLHGIR